MQLRVCKVYLLYIKKQNMKIFTSNENSKYNPFENISDEILVNGFF